MKILAIMLIGLFYGAHLSASEIELRAVYSVGGPPLGTVADEQGHTIKGPDSFPQKKLNVYIYLINRGKSQQKLATNLTSTISYGKDGFITIDCYADWYDNLLGYKLVSPESSLDAVLLRNGEASMLLRQFEIPGEINVRKITVSVKIREDFAARHGIWSGQLEGIAESYDKILSAKNEKFIRDRKEKESISHPTK